MAETVAENVVELNWLHHMVSEQQQNSVACLFHTPLVGFVGGVQDQQCSI